MRDVAARHLCLHLTVTAGLAWAIVVTASGQGAPASSPSVLSGVYTKEQATRGEKLYAQMCAECHGDDLAGLDQAPALAGPEFGTAWQGAPLSALLGKIRQMPPDTPNAFSRPEMVDLISYLLSANGLTSGTTALTDEQSVLTQMKFEMPPLAN